MKPPIKLLSFFIIFAFLVGCSGALAKQENPNVKADGTITLYLPNGTPQCTFPAASGTFHFPNKSTDDYPCKQLRGGGFFKLNNVPSATKLWLLNGKPKPGQLETLPLRCIPGADVAFGWWELLTIKNPTTTDPQMNNGLIRIEDLKTLSVGSVVTPGVRLVGADAYTHPEPDRISCLIIEVSPLASAASDSNTAEPAKLTLEGANGEHHCTLDFKTQNYVFKGNAHCNNDEAIKLELEHAPSASNILLFDDYSCDRNDDGNYFWVYLRTIKEDVSTVSLIDLDDIATAPIGSVVAPGIRLMDRHQKSGESMKKRTSCVQIQVDAPPLPPVKRH
ncbi:MULTISPECIES: hypothetical protein [Pseudomonas syringae group]|uniref:hypothetical protein n=1 Tax=Pseudomonas syringae group TaxID=136849 RepID=UPI0004031AB4|nr:MULTISPECIES: hypothetical protein [Pseudomonas syringae group]KPZ29134.1 hypothetical protein ALO38_200046 [Pseudomonas coronafaciens pv. zizaniae]KPB54143.1 Uncharacterized protein AC511_2853 [Pseudomonas coronafaciens pv. oryzae]KPX34651.1 hypothetical protein ALO77_200128 [Pseudomonas coronafaciens pv. garcae]KPY04998.1 Uncharacterized protein ALO57_04162 [Pseudomonas coronafaciens pv. oryzae]RMS89647.1 hypothetical protein ALP57_200153 [Pseudomonas coronafaciens pv. oryzae]